MTEEIIIDGVDVAGCEHHLSTGYCQLQMIFQGMVLKLPFGKHLECNLCDKDCYYKQRKRLEQENKELKEENSLLSYNLHIKEDEARHYLNETSKYRSALEEINILVKNYCNACDEIKVKTYKNKNDCLYCNYGFIKRKINEVLK